MKNHRDKILLTGGHFMLKNSLPLLNPGTISSFKSAILKYNEISSENKYVGILINDIGTSCNSVECSIVKNEFDREKFKLPEEYLQILKQNNFSSDKLIIFWEKHMRNRGKKELLKKIKKIKNIKKIDGNYWLVLGNKKYLLSREREKDKYGNVACPLIMAAFQLEQERLGFTDSINFYYIGEDNSFNIPDPFVIDKGIIVAKTFGSKINLKNIYLK